MVLTVSRFRVPPSLWPGLLTPDRIGGPRRRGLLRYGENMASVGRSPRRRGDFFGLVTLITSLPRNVCDREMERAKARRLLKRSAKPLCFLLVVALLLSLSKYTVAYREFPVGAVALPDQARDKITILTIGGMLQLSYDQQEGEASDNQQTAITVATSNMSNDQVYMQPLQTEAMGCGNNYLSALTVSIETSNQLAYEEKGTGERLGDGLRWQLPLCQPARGPRFQARGHDVRCRQLQHRNSRVQPRLLGEGGLPDPSGPELGQRPNGASFPSSSTS